MVMTIQYMVRVKFTTESIGCDESGQRKNDVFFSEIQKNLTCYCFVMVDYIKLTDYCIKILTNEMQI